MRIWVTIYTPTTEVIGAFTSAPWAHNAGTMDRRARPGRKNLDYIVVETELENAP